MRESESERVRENENKGREMGRREKGGGRRETREEERRWKREGIREERGERFFYDIHLRTRSRRNTVLIDRDKLGNLAAFLA